jgi:small subunit ribosomal protein S6e
MRLVISDPKTGKSYQNELPKEQEGAIAGKRIGEQIDGGVVGAAGYSLELTGGSDGSGFPMKVDVPGNRKMASLVTKGIGFFSKRKGERRRKMVRGNNYTQDIVQVNAKVVKPGSVTLEELFGKKDKPEEGGTKAAKEEKK